jgi:hypothetical protein
MAGKSSMPNTPGLRIGITIGLQSEGESLWINGIKQNALFLRRALLACPSVRSCALVNTTGVRITSSLPWDLNQIETKTFDEAKDELDVLIELGGQIDQYQTEHLKSRNARVVSYCCGVEYINGMEAVLFGRALWGSNLFVNQRYDDLWVIPQVTPSSAHYLATLRRIPFQVVPFVWHPEMVESQVSTLPGKGCYAPGPAKKRLVVMEPNINVVKFCLYPILIAETAFRHSPDRIAGLEVTNADHLAHTSQDFVAIMNQLDIVRQHKAVFTGRHQTPLFLSARADVVISHQWENALNYFYLEVAWLGYPLVHNAHLVPDLGYFYKDNDVLAGASKLLHVLEHHDTEFETYRTRQRQSISQFLPSNPWLVASYESLLQRLMRQPLR